MSDPGDEHQERVTPVPPAAIPDAGGDELAPSAREEGAAVVKEAAAPDPFPLALAEMEAGQRRYDEVRAMQVKHAAEGLRLQQLEKAVYAELQVLRTVTMNLRLKRWSDFDARGLRSRPDPPVRLNPNNNSWEER